MVEALAAHLAVLMECKSVELKVVTMVQRSAGKMASMKVASMV